MRFVRYQIESQTPLTGWILNDKVGFVNGDIFSEFQREETSIS